jgi:hypothetical protein
MKFSNELLKIASFSILAFTPFSQSHAATAVAPHGALSVKGNQIIDSTCYQYCLPARAFLE